MKSYFISFVVTLEVTLGMNEEGQAGDCMHRLDPFTATRARTSRDKSAVHTQENAVKREEGDAARDKRRSNSLLETQ